MSIFPSVEMNKVPRISHANVSRLLNPLFRRLVLCIVLTIPAGTLLPRYVVPEIIFLCASGAPLGFAGAVLLQLWVLTLVDMWRHVWWDLRLLRATKASAQPVLERSLAESSPEI